MRCGALARDPKGVLDNGELGLRRAPDHARGKTVGYAVYSLHAAHPFVDIWLSVVALNALVLVLALAVFAPFLIYRSPASR